MRRIITVIDPEVTKLLRESGLRNIILLEGKTDLGIFKIWYSDFRKEIEFKDAGEKFKVQENVRLAIEQGYGNVVHGIIDRDFVSADDWHEEPQENCHCLRWHELENYLLHSESISGQLAIHHSPNDPPNISVIEKHLKSIAKESVSRTAGNWLLAAKECELLPDSGLEPRDAVLRHLVDNLVCSEIDAEQWLSQTEELARAALQNFDSLHSFFEGKRLFHHIRQLHFRTLPKDQLRNVLAQAVMAHGIPVEIRTIVETKILGRTKSD